VVIDIHGGPESQYCPGFSAFTQYLVNELGCVVIGAQSCAARQVTGAASCS
jgi:dipeptidyl aminopeptidase/acylaminoacyl peptidase